MTMRDFITSAVLGLLLGFAAIYMIAHSSCRYEEVC